MRGFVPLQGVLNYDQSPLALIHGQTVKVPQNCLALWMIFPTTTAFVPNFDRRCNAILLLALTPVVNVKEAKQRKVIRS